MMLFSVFQVDSNAFMVAQEDLKYQADDMAATAVLFFEPDAYGDGYKIFDDATANAKVEDHLAKNMNLVNDVVEKGYFSGNTVSYKIYYFDDSGQVRTYIDGSLHATEAFTYGTMFEEELTGYKKLIVRPTAVVTINAGPPKYRLDFLQAIAKNVIQTSAYEYVGR